ncbi:hypothetical protein JB92DRAFT_2905040 [Gautieria morchelliformis]|nr:hypothetical protein JB92DRAFT_2905040 [Gautieria morchelliformis]
MLSTFSPPPRQPSPLPRRTDSLSTSIAKPKPASLLAQSRQDAQSARIVLNASLVDEVPGDETEREQRRGIRDRELTNMLERMTGWVEELATLLQQAYKSQTDLETALTLTRSNLQLALANNEMLEEALKRGGGGGQDVGWRRWSEREGVRRSGSVKEYVQHERPNSSADLQQQQPSVPSRFFNFKTSLQRMSSTNTSPTATSASPPYASTQASASTPSLLPSITIPSMSRSESPAPPPVPSITAVATSTASSSRASSPSPTHTARDAQLATSQSHPLSRSMSQSTQPTPREKELSALLEKERAALNTLASAKTKLEEELESLTQALFEEANKMVSKANRQLAETEEELRIATEQKEALRGALRIVEGENGALRGVDEVKHSATGRDKQNLPGVKDKRELEEKDAEGPGEQSTAGVSCSHQEMPAQPRSTPLPNRTPPNPHARPTIPVVTMMHPHPAATGNTGSFWSPVTPLSDTGEGVGRDTPTTSSRSPISASHSVSPTTAPWKASSTGSPPDPPDTEAAIRSSKSHLTVTDPHVPNHQWPATSSSRDAVRNELEDAMRRMQEIVGEGEGENEDDGVMGNDIRKGEEDQENHDSGDGDSQGTDKQSGLDAPRLDGGVNPWRT